MYESIVSNMVPLIHRCPHLCPTILKQSEHVGPFVLDYYINSMSRPSLVVEFLNYRNRRRAVSIIKTYAMGRPMLRKQMQLAHVNFLTQAL